MRRTVIAHGQKLAFTLLEMMLALSGFLLLSGALFGLLMATLRTANELRDKQNQEEEVQALAGYLRKKLAEPDATTQILSWVSPDAKEHTSSGLMIGEPSDFEVLIAVPDAHGSMELRSAQVSHVTGASVGGRALNILSVTLAPEVPEWPWRTLLSNLSFFSCRFQTPEETDSWSEKWVSPSHRPGLVEIQLQLVGQSHPEILDFRVTPIIRPTRKVLTPDTTTN